MPDRSSLETRLPEGQAFIGHTRLDILRAELDLGASSGPGIPAEQAFAKARARVADVAADYDVPGCSWRAGNRPADSMKDQSDFGGKPSA